MDHQPIAVPFAITTTIIIVIIITKTSNPFPVLAIKMKSFTTLVLAVLATAGPMLAEAKSVSESTLYLIRHGEKPEDDDQIGLSTQGMMRAQCLRDVFGANSTYNITYIMAQTPKDTGKRRRPLDTVTPLAQDLGITVDISCDRDDNKCVKDVVEAYDGPGNILVCWEHKQLNNIVKELGGDIDQYPSDHFDLIWTDPSPFDEITSITSEMCPGIDSTCMC
ncbi:hypothetical protein ESCO_003525 [Escovopsis weberi]|uniref:Phosphoglycerate mutase family protein n=1 Tax=Escovopsis weberi TaxID=150374 RepID=A0A0M8N9Z4_ESCWE|nr:hypothetical protein ESCO_003525 [Escovopsis weberi]